MPYVRSAPLKLGSSAAAGRGRHRHERLFADAETAEDQIENVVVSSRACDFVERTKCVVEIEQQHLVWNATVNGLFSRIQSVEGIANQRLMAGVGQESRFGGRNSVAGDMAKDRGPNLRNAFAGESGGAD